MSIMCGHTHRGESSQCGDGDLVVEMHDGTSKLVTAGRREKSEVLPDGRSETRGCLVPVEGPGKRVTEGENDSKTEEWKRLLTWKME